VIAIELPVSFADITAFMLTFGKRRVLAVSVYVPSNYPAGTTPIKGWGELCARLRLINELIERTKNKWPDMEVVVAGDFNRHDILWGGPSIRETYRQGEAEPFISFIDQFDLQSWLMPDEITWESSRHKSIVDLSRASEGLSNNLIRCTLWDNEYGSDYRAIVTEFDITEERGQPEPRLMVRHA